MYNYKKEKCFWCRNFSDNRVTNCLLVCTRTLHTEQLTSWLVPSSSTFGVDKCPSELLVKHISGISGLVLCLSPPSAAELLWLRLITSLYMKETAECTAQSYSDSTNQFSIISSQIKG